MINKMKIPISDLEMECEVKLYNVPGKDIKGYVTLIFGQLFKIPGFTVRESKYKTSEDSSDRNNYWVAQPAVIRPGGRRFYNFFVLDGEWWKNVEKQILDQFFSELEQSNLPAIEELANPP